MDLYQQIFFSTLSVSFGLLYLILFLYNQRSKSNLYFAIFMLFYACNIFFDFQASLLPEVPEKLIFLRLHRAVLPFTLIFALLLSYDIFNRKIAKPFWLISTGLIITGAIAVYDPINNFVYMQFLLLAGFLESARIFSLSMYQKKDGAFLLGTGFTFLFLFSLYDLFMDLNIIQPFHDINNGYPFGFLCLIVTISIYLSRDFARINKKIITQEISTKELELKQRLLEEQNARKSKELEDARMLQLSMLPQCINELNGLEICFSMKTATEVGGDYYDYIISDDGIVTFAIGDATGHGMKAGIMVSVIKSLFLTQSDYQDITSFFNICSRTIKQMRLGKLYMALMLVKIQDGMIRASSAGMPPFFVYRKKTGSLEEFIMKGMPLGAVSSFDYQTIETKLEPGDTVLLMSDGLPELFNNQNEMLDYHKIKELFKEAAELSANDIVNHLFSAGDKWRNGRAQMDDITVIAFKYHPKTIN
jgi:serine phosphatase RsbU (regulator of sigma subunit)